MSLQKAKINHQKTAKLFLLSALFVTLWIIYLSLNIPANYKTKNWDVAWVGFDLLMLGNLLMAAYSLWKRKASSAIYLAILGGALIIDMWFDITTSSGGDLVEAILLGVLLELPLAVFLIRLAHKILLQALKGSELSSIEIDPY